jgi:hypothetical protein
VACEACGADTFQMGFCDERIHLLCAACLEKSSGRGSKDCPRCQGKMPPKKNVEQVEWAQGSRIVSGSLVPGVVAVDPDRSLAGWPSPKWRSGRPFIHQGLYAGAERLLDRLALDEPIRLVGVAAFDLVEPGQMAQNDMFLQKGVERRSKLEHTMDEIQKKFGNKIGHGDE